MIPIAVVEDNQTVRDTLAGWINSSPEYCCVCGCTTGKEALVEIPRHKPAVVLMDIHLPGESGIACTARLKEKMPELQVIMVTVYKDHDLIFQALRAGACGYLLKRAGREEILRGIAEVLVGGAPMTGEIARRVIEVFHRPAPAPEAAALSPRENEVLEFLSSGLSNKQIAVQLGISYETVCVHLRRVYEKLHVRSRTEAVIKHLQGRAAQDAALRGMEFSSLSESASLTSVGAEQEAVVTVAVPERRYPMLPADTSCAALKACADGGTNTRPGAARIFPAAHRQRG
jgi:DNA-binding NarL/FixJ family response regulator